MSGLGLGVGHLRKTYGHPTVLFITSLDYLAPSSSPVRPSARPPAVISAPHEGENATHPYPASPSSRPALPFLSKYACLYRLLSLTHAVSVSCATPLCLSNPWQLIVFVIGANILASEFKALLLGELAPFLI